MALFLKTNQPSHQTTIPKCSFGDLYRDTKDECVMLVWDKTSEKYYFHSKAGNFETLRGFAGQKNYCAVPLSTNNP